MIDACVSTVTIFALSAIFEIFSNEILRQEEVPLFFFFFKNLQMLAASLSSFFLV